VPIRIIGGEARGRLLKGGARPGTRPTSERVREALFALLEARGASFERVLDLYSGTGALGIEALSRGAAHCDFVESDPRACEVIRENLRITGFAGRATVHCAPVSRALRRLEGGYTLVVADPPYEYDRAESEIGAVIERGLMAPDGLLVVEHSKRKEWPEALGGRRRILKRRHGDTALTVYQ
jgi:16S rRNA (guanine966-N2)-methyltransferase